MDGSSGDFVERSNVSRQNIRIWIPIDPGLLLETNSPHLKMDGWKMNFLLGWPIFRGELLVSGRVVVFFCGG